MKALFFGAHHYFLAFLSTLFVMRLLLILYSLVWATAIPFLRRSPRLSKGFRQRLGDDLPAAPIDIWIQAASGGEAQLTSLVLAKLRDQLPKKERLTILVTSGTTQGVETLEIFQQSLPTGSPIHIEVRYFPFDAPWIMKQAFTAFSPRLAVLVETELWPGFLSQAYRQDVPVLLINGRMSEKSYGSYRYLGWFFRKYGPRKTWAISTLDRDRFSRVMAPASVGLMNNIKFDRITPPKKSERTNSIHSILPPGSPFIVLGSIRREEEDKILTTIETVLAREPKLTIGLFPKHLERCDFWLKVLQGKDIKAFSRSRTDSPPEAGCVLIWDVFGELAGAYELAHSAFVGGSLINLGGQNFLEPLVFGLRPIIGPHWKNFAWVGREIVEVGLVKEVKDERRLATALLRELQSSPDKSATTKKVAEFFESKKGGSQQMSMEILHLLQETKGTAHG